MRTGKWLASSVILFILMRSLVLSGPVHHYNQSHDGDEESRVLSRAKRFSMNEYLVILITVFNAFIFFYNNVETFFPTVLKSRQAVSSSNNFIIANQPPNIITSNQQSSPVTPASILTKRPKIDSFNVNESPVQSAEERSEMIDTVAEMLISGEISTDQVPEYIRWEVVELLNMKMQQQQRDLPDIVNTDVQLIQDNPAAPAEAEILLN